LRLTAQEQAKADNSREGRIHPPLVWRANCTFSIHNINYIDQKFLCNQKIIFFRHRFTPINTIILASENTEK